MTTYDRIMKLIYLPFGLVVGTISSTVASKLWRKAWRTAAHEKTLPRILDRDRSWLEILVASAIRGMIFGVVRALFRRGGATAFAHVTATWPGRESGKPH